MTSCPDETVAKGRFCRAQRGSESDCPVGVGGGL